MTVSVDTSPYKPRLPPSNTPAPDLSRWTYEELSRVSAAIQQSNSSLTAVAGSTGTVFGGSGSGHAAGLVPDPGATAGFIRWLNEGGSWVQGVDFNIWSFGGVGDGTTDNTTALTNALAALKTLTTCGGRIAFGGGKFKFSSNLQFTFPSNNAQFSVTLWGVGQDGTELTFGNTDGIQFNYESGTDFRVMQSVHVMDLTFTTSATGTHTALTLVEGGTGTGNYAAMSTLDRVTFRGADIYAGTQHWGTDLVISDVSNVNINCCIFQGPAGTPVGTAIIAQGSSSSEISCCINLCGNTQINQKSVGIDFADHLQGVSCVQVIWNGCTTGINVPTGLSGDDSYLVVDNCQFGQFNAGNCIVIGSEMNDTFISNTLFLFEVANCGAVVASVTSGTTITQNRVESASATNTVGFSLAGTVSASTATISDNSFSNCATAVKLLSTSSNVQLGLNKFINCTTNVSNAGTNNFAILENDYPGSYALGVYNNGGTSSSHGIALHVGKTAALDSGSSIITVGSGDGSQLVGYINRVDTGMSIGLVKLLNLAAYTNSAPADGDLWYDGTHLNFRHGATTTQIV